MTSWNATKSHWSAVAIGMTCLQASPLQRRMAQVPADEYQDYDIPGEALTDEKFRKMITEAEKYLGYPYVWGGSSPSTSFDCSGFVSWVINHCGNGWNVGRQTANGLMGKCDIIPKGEAKPGDLIFFQKTYNTSGASHVGIYVGNGMMITAATQFPMLPLRRTTGGSITTVWEEFDKNRAFIRPEKDTT